MVAGDVCGSGFNPRKHGKVCHLHTSIVSSETLLSYWQQLPVEHREMLFSLPRHDFEAELDSCCTCDYPLRLRPYMLLASPAV